MDLDFSPGCVVARTCLVSITCEDTIADRVMPVSFPYPSGSIICNNNVMELKGIISKLSHGKISLWSRLKNVSAKKRLMNLKLISTNASDESEEPEPETEELVQICTPYLRSRSR